MSQRNRDFPAPPNHYPMEVEKRKRNLWYTQRLNILVLLIFDYSDLNKSQFHVTQCMAWLFPKNKRKKIIVIPYRVSRNKQHSYKNKVFRCEMENLTFFLVLIWKLCLFCKCINLSLLSDKSFKRKQQREQEQFYDGQRWM